MKKIKENYINQDVFTSKEFVTDKRYQEIINPIKKLAVSRNDKYGNSIAILEDSEIIALMLMKLIRTKSLLTRDKIEDKFYDEIEDVINYAVYVLRRHKDKKES